MVHPLTLVAKWEFPPQLWKKTQIKYQLSLTFSHFHFTGSPIKKEGWKEGDDERRVMGKFGTHSTETIIRVGPIYFVSTCSTLAWLEQVRTETGVGRGQGSKESALVSGRANTEERSLPVASHLRPKHYSIVVKCKGPGARIPGFKPQLPTY